MFRSYDPFHKVWVELNLPGEPEISLHFFKPSVCIIPIVDTFYNLTSKRALGGPQRINQKPITCCFHPWGTIWQQTNFAWVFNKMGYQGMSGRSSFIWYGSKFCLVIFLRVQMTVSIFLALQELNFKLTRATENKCSIPFCAKGARKKMHAIISKVNISTISGPILKISSSVTPYICIMKQACSYGELIS